MVLWCVSCGGCGCGVGGVNLGTVGDVDSCGVASGYVRCYVVVDGVDIAYCVVVAYDSVVAGSVVVVYDGVDIAGVVVVWCMWCQW